MDTAAPVGFIGLGAMGGRMAARLLDAGLSLAVFDTRPDALTAFAARGARVCGSGADVARTAPTVMLSLPSPDVVLAVATGTEGLCADGSLVRTCIDLSTTGPATEQRLAGILAGAGIALVDAPVSGGVYAAERGTLTVMAACASERLVEVRPLLELIGSRVFHVGEEPGLGQLAKVINNLLSATALAATAEAVALGVSRGLRAGTLIDVLNASSGRNSATEEKFPRAVLNRKFDTGFALALMNKDVQLCLQEAARTGLPMSLGDAVGELWADAAAGARPDADCTELVEIVEKAAGVRIGDAAPD